jgi:hypothetical protein
MLTYSSGISLLDEQYTFLAKRLVASDISLFVVVDPGTYKGFAKLDLLSIHDFGL